VPKWVLISKDKNIIKAFVRGIFDTDGSFWCEKSNASTSKLWKRKNNYIPQLGITSCSKILLVQIQSLLIKLDFKAKLKQKNKAGFKNQRKIHDSFMLMIRNKQEIERWFQVIGTNNLRHKTRYEVWKKLGYLPPKTDIRSRIKILEKYSK
jgi:intein/homing endonuclease